MIDRSTSGKSGHAALALATLFALTFGAADGAGAAQDAGKARLLVSRIGKPPKSSAPGERIGLAGALRNRGRRGSRGQLELLIPDGPGHSGRRLVAKVSPRVKPHSRRRFRLAFDLPDDLVPGFGEPDASYPLRACVRHHGDAGRFRCRRTRRRLRVPNPLPELPLNFTAGARSAGDPLFPQIGNGGYDVSHYDLDLDYNPASNRLRAGTRATITATATKDLGELSLDFQDLDVGAVRVDGAAAYFSQRRAKPALAGATQPFKLIVDPSTGIESGSEFTVKVRYSGTPVEIVDPDGSREGWVRACLGAATSLTCDGSLVVNEPIGAQGWFPSNDHPSDKATFSTRITVPSVKTAIGIGELEGRTANGDGTRTWTWKETHPTATYLTTATVGDFDYTEGTLTETGVPRAIPTYRAIDSDATVIQRNSINAKLDRTESMVNFLAGIYDGYPFDAAGAVVDNVPTLGYALEVQTKPHFATLSVDAGTLLHEYAHQWFGDAVSPRTWLEIWFNEGWAEWSTWYWAFTEDGDPESPADIFASEYAGASAADWSVPPATLDDDPANLFDEFPVYVRSPMTLEAYREIVGDAKFFELATELQNRYGYGDVSTSQVIALAKEISDLSGAKLQLLDDFFQQWLYGDVKPTILPSDF